MNDTQLWHETFVNKLSTMHNCSSTMRRSREEALPVSSPVVSDTDFTAKGHVFTFTGFQDNTLVAAIKEAGGDVRRLMKGSVSAVIAADVMSDSAKLRIARARRLPIYDVNVARAALACDCSVHHSSHSSPLAGLNDLVGDNDNETVVADLEDDGDPVANPETTLIEKHAAVTCEEEEEFDDEEEEVDEEDDVWDEEEEVDDDGEEGSEKVDKLEEAEEPTPPDVRKLVVVQEYGKGKQCQVAPYEAG